MFLKKLNNLHKTLALKMTTWYVGVFALSFIVTFVVVFMLIVTIVNQRMDDDLEEDIEDFASLLKQGGFGRIKEEMLSDT
ncbi:MAG: hypothetical protein DBP00_17000, partial [gamma proteobacterium symbiont of Ctena orbiculata]